MTDKASLAEDRAARLAAALRANLHRRKAQARGVRDAAPELAPEPSGEAPGQPDQ